MSYTKKDLFNAIRAGNAKQVIQILSVHSDWINYKNSDGYTPLGTAIYFLSEDRKVKIDEAQGGLSPRQGLIMDLLNLGADAISITDSEQFCALQVVISRGSRLYDDGEPDAAKLYLKIAEQLFLKLNNAQQLNSRLNELLTPRKGKVKKVKHTVVQLAIYFGYAEMVSLCLQQHPDLSITNQCSLDALHLSVLIGIHDKDTTRHTERLKITTEILDYLWKEKLFHILNKPWKGKWRDESDKLFPISVEGKNDTPLHNAVRQNNLPYVGLLCRYDALTSVQNDDKKTAYDIAHDNNVLDENTYKKVFRCIDAARNNLPELDFDLMATNSNAAVGNSRTPPQAINPPAPQREMTPVAETNRGASSSSTASTVTGSSTTQQQHPNVQKPTVVMPATDTMLSTAYEEKTKSIETLIKTITTKKSLTDNTPNDKSAQELQDHLIKALESTENAVEANCVPVLGNTTTGKSTLCNQLCGKEIIIRSKLGIEQAIVKDKKQELFKIGHTHNATTLYPQVIQVPNTGAITSPFAICDFPGIGENRGPLERMATTISSLLVIHAAASIPALIITISNDELKGTASDFVKLLDYLSSFIDNFEELNESIIFVITKVPNPDNTSVADIKGRVLNLIHDVKVRMEKLTDSAVGGITKAEEYKNKSTEIIAQLKILDLILNSQNIIINNVVDTDLAPEILQMVSEMKPVAKSRFRFVMEDNLKQSFINHIMTKTVEPGLRLLEAKFYLHTTIREVTLRSAEMHNEIKQFNENIAALKNNFNVLGDDTINRFENQKEEKIKATTELKKQIVKLQNKIAAEKTKIERFEKDDFEYITRSVQASRSAMNVLGVWCEVQLSYEDSFAPYHSIKVIKCENGTYKNEISDTNQTFYHLTFAPNSSEIGKCEIEIKINKKNKYETKLQVQQCNTRINTLNAFIYEKNQEISRLEAGIKSDQDSINKLKKAKEKEIQATRAQEKAKLESLRGQTEANLKQLSTKLSALQKKLLIINETIHSHMPAFDLVVKMIPVLQISSPLIDQLRQQYESLTSQYIVFTFSEEDYPLKVEVTSVHLIGKFNDWNLEDKWRLNRLPSGLWEISQEMSPEDKSSQYQFVINGDLKQKWPPLELEKTEDELTLADDVDASTAPDMPSGERQLVEDLLIAMRDPKISDSKIKCSITSQNVNACDTQQSSALHIAVICKREKIIPCLIKKGAIVDAQDGFGKTALSLACENEMEDTVKLLVKFHANLILPDSDGNTPLHILAKKGDQPIALNILKFLLKKGGRACIVQNRALQSPLHTAAQYGQKLALKELVTCCLTIPSRETKFQQLQRINLLNAYDHFGDTYFHTAVRNNHCEVVEDLHLRAKFDINTPNKSEDTALKLAIRGRSLQMVKLLLLYGSRFDITSQANQDPDEAISQNSEQDSEITAALFLHKKQKFLNQILPKTIDKSIQKTLLERLMEEKEKNFLAFITNQKWGDLLTVSKPIRKTIEKEYKTTTQGQTNEEKIQSLIQLIKEIIQKITFRPGPKPDRPDLDKRQITKTHQEKEFEKSLKNHLLKIYYISVGILEGLAVRPPEGGDRAAFVIEKIGSAMPQMASLMAQLVPTDNFLISFIANKVGLQGKEQQVTSALATGVGLAAQLAFNLVASIIKSNVEAHAKERLIRIKETFEELGKNRVNDDKIDAIVLAMRDRFSDQINQLDDLSINRFALCIGQRILTHVIEDKDRYVKTQSRVMSLFKPAKMPNEIDIVLRCFKALHHQTDIGIGTGDRLTFTPTSKKGTAQWYAAGIIDRTGRKIRLANAQGYHYYIKEDVNKDESYGLYGFCTVPENSVDSLKKQGYSKSLITTDIFDRHPDEIESEENEETASSATAFTAF